MKLLQLDSPALLDTVSAWLARPENYQWLDFGNGRQRVSREVLKIMQQQPAHFMRVYTGMDDSVPIGIVALNNVNLEYGTGTLWGVTGEKSFRSRGYATFAASRFLTLAFQELGLRAINTWAVAHNPSVRIMERLNFRRIGRQRQCHRIDGHMYDRILFDLLANEHREIDLAAWAGNSRAGFAITA